MPTGTVADTDGSLDTSAMSAWRRMRSAVAQRWGAQLSVALHGATARWLRSALGQERAQAARAALAEAQASYLGRSAGRDSPSIIASSRTLQDVRHASADLLCLTLPAPPPCSCPSRRLVAAAAQGPTVKGERPPGAGQ